MGHCCWLILDPIGKIPMGSRPGHAVAARPAWIFASSVLVCSDSHCPARSRLLLILILSPFLLQVVLKGDARRLNVHGVSAETPLGLTGMVLLVPITPRGGTGMCQHRMKLVGNWGGKIPARNSWEAAPPPRAFPGLQHHSRSGSVRGHFIGSCAFTPSLTPILSPAADLCRLPGGFQGEGGAGGAAVPARLPPKVSTAQRGAGISSPRGFFSLTFPLHTLQVPGEVAGGALRVPHVQQAHGGAGTAPRWHRDAAGRVGVSGPVSLGGTNASSRRIWDFGAGVFNSWGRCVGFGGGFYAAPGCSLSGPPGLADRRQSPRHGQGCAPAAPRVGLFL